MQAIPLHRLLSLLFMRLPDQSLLVELGIFIVQIVLMISWDCN